MFICGTITVLVTGYGCGLGNRRNFVPAAMMSLILAMIILVIMDLDRPPAWVYQGEPAEPDQASTKFKSRIGVLNGIGSKIKYFNVKIQGNSMLCCRGRF
ncbi:MAG: hypothetical protein L3J17_01055 [Candidatus Jettenia sp.]|nr:MAG: hypothetical protein L3J17_01055 [Candidatus Jettenia sp.]